MQTIVAWKFGITSTAASILVVGTISIVGGGEEQPTLNIKATKPNNDTFIG